MPDGDHGPTVGGASLAHDARNAVASLYLVSRRWRVGRRVARNVYARVGDKASDVDVLIGQFDTGELARAAVKAHNAALRPER